MRAVIGGGGIIGLATAYELRKRGRCRGTRSGTDGHGCFLGQRGLDRPLLLRSAPGLENLFVATAHNMLGVTLAPATGFAMADLISTGDSAADLRPFDPARFNH